MLTTSHLAVVHRSAYSDWSQNEQRLFETRGQTWFR